MRVALIDTLALGVLDPDRAQRWYDRGLKPHPDQAWRGLQYGAGRRVGVVRQYKAARGARR